MKKRLSDVFATVLLTLLLFMLVGCTEEKEAKTQDENIQTIEAVLQNSLTGPSDELKQIVDQESEEKLAALRQHEEKLFKDYFANETSYTEFVNDYGSTSMIEAIKNDYQLQIKKIDYEKVDEKDSVYDFSVEIQLQKEGSESSKDQIVTGQANLNDEHKIETMLIRIEDLYKSMIN
ncbi:hypothetical protein [Bacillus sp. E214]|uniref:hypothetical protein n=1 Tax=Bacillus sp. E214 TaxID=2587156 RepID=UPI0011DFA36A|nr:hypothetical protein [Bacillus sp. E214]